LSIADVIVGCVIIAILAVGGTSIFGLVKDSLVDADNYYEASKFSMETIEDLQVLPYSDLIVSATPYDRPLDACKLKDIRSGTRSYVINQKYWDAPGTTYGYKEIISTTSWIYKGKDKTISLAILRRNDG